MDSRPLGAGTVRRIAHRVNAASINPAIVEIEERANRNRVVDRFIAIANRVQSSNVFRLDPNRISIHFPYKTKKLFLRIRQRAALRILQHTFHQFGIVQQFRRDRGVRLRSKRTFVQL
jgi:hypothetical protein